MFKHCMIQMVKVLTIINSSAKSIKTQIATLIRTAMTQSSQTFFAHTKLVFINISLFPYVTTCITHFHMITRQWVNYNLIICCRVRTFNNNACDNNRDKLFVYTYIVYRGTLSLPSVLKT